MKLYLAPLLLGTLVVVSAQAQPDSRQLQVLYGCIGGCQRMMDPTTQAGQMCIAKCIGTYLGGSNTNNRNPAVSSGANPAAAPAATPAVMPPANTNIANQNTAFQPFPTNNFQSNPPLFPQSVPMTNTMFSPMPSPMPGPMPNSLSASPGVSQSGNTVQSGSSSQAPHSTGHAEPGLEGASVSQHEVNMAMILAIIAGTLAVM
ncbi:uncharacterized protein VTP21DRAFT_5138 [Calcarisporiella thermophila]|uniref:uncharacterized protein n=1 Tax=Calcarisporiella thermophila TaxID=911321 RepID=UPI0037430C21